MFYVLTPLILLRVLYQGLSEPRYKETLLQRFGFVSPITEQRLIWVHAVSAGETNAAAPLVNRLLAAGYKVLITTMTPTGRERVERLFGSRVYHTYAPYDLPMAVNRFISRTGAVSLVIVDTELWPNMIWHAHKAGLQVLLVNGRMSERSARGYARVAPLTRLMLSCIDIVAVQTQSHGDRFEALGLDRSRLEIAGSIKFDITLPADLEDRTKQIRQRLGSRRIFIAASTHEGEEEILLEAFAELKQKDSLMVLAPRHPRRAPEVARLCCSHELKVVRHSEAVPVSRDTSVYLLDTIGELMYFYNVADLAFVGGSLVPVGGHNPMEPAGVGVPVIMGPYQQNIDDIGAMFQEAQGMIVCDSASSLTLAIDEVFSDENLRRSLIANASGVMEENRGALDKVVRLVLDHACP